MEQSNAAKVGSYFPWTSGLLRLVWPARPARRKRWVVVAGVILLLVAAHTAWTAVASSRLNLLTDRLAERWGHMGLSSLAPPPVEDRDNAAKPVRAAGELVELPEQMVGRPNLLHTFGSYDPRDVSSADQALLRAIVEDNALALRVLDEAIHRSAANWDVRYRDGVEARIPNLLQILNLARLNVVAGRLALLEGRTDDAVAAIERGLAIERATASEPILIMQLVRSTVQRFHTALLRDALTRGALDDGRLSALAAGWAERPADNSLEAALITEAKAMVAAVMEGVAADDAPAIVETLGRLARPVVIDNARAYLEVMDRAVTCASQPRAERDDSCAKSAGAEKLGRYYAFAKTMMFNFGATLDRVDAAAARSAQAAVAIALERQRLRHGSYPDALAALAPEWLAALPTDPLTGRAFEYARRDDGYTLTTEAPLDQLMANAPPQDPVLTWAVRR